MTKGRGERGEAREAPDRFPSARVRDPSLMRRHQGNGWCGADMPLSRGSVGVTSAPGPRVGGRGGLQAQGGRPAPVGPDTLWERSRLGSVRPRVTGGSPSDGAWPRARWEGRRGLPPPPPTFAPPFPFLLRCFVCFVTASSPLPSLRHVWPFLAAAALLPTEQSSFSMQKEGVETDVFCPSTFFLFTLSEKQR